MEVVMSTFLSCQIVFLFRQFLFYLSVYRQKSDDTVKTRYSKFYQGRINPFNLICGLPIENIADLNAQHLVQIRNEIQAVYPNANTATGKKAALRIFLK
jgi:hypothetical protein